MTVASVIKAKASEVRTIQPWVSIGEAVRRLGAPPRIGALVVRSENGRVLGTVTERDIVRGLVERGSALLEMSCENIMSRKVPTCAPRDSLASVMRTMTESRYRHIPVMHAGELVGLVSIGDVVRARLKDSELEAAVLRDMVISRG